MTTQEMIDEAVIEVASFYLAAHFNKINCWHTISVATSGSVFDVASPSRETTNWDGRKPGAVDVLQFEIRGDWSDVLGDELKSTLGENDEIIYSQDGDIIPTTDVEDRARDLIYQEFYDRGMDLDVLGHLEIFFAEELEAERLERTSQGVEILTDGRLQMKKI